jgi:hypothetical protein
MFTWTIFTSTVINMHVSLIFSVVKSCANYAHLVEVNVLERDTIFCSLSLRKFARWCVNVVIIGDANFYLRIALITASYEN